MRGAMKENMRTKRLANRYQEGAQGARKPVDIFNPYAKSQPFMFNAARVDLREYPTPSTRRKGTKTKTAMNAGKAASRQHHVKSTAKTVAKTIAKNTAKTTVKAIAKADAKGKKSKLTQHKSASKKQLTKRATTAKLEEADEPEEDSS